MTARNPEFDNVDPLRDAYRGVRQAPGVVKSLSQYHTALMCIDVQYLDAAPGHGVFRDAEASGVAPEAQAYYFDRLQRIALPNMQRLMRAFRERELEVIHTRIMSMTKNGRDRSAGHKRLNLHAAPGSKEAEFLPEVAPEGDEIVFNKTASGVFTSTNIGFVLTNLKVTGLWIMGVYTNECVETTARDASDLGYYTTVIEDACATVTPDLHYASIKTMRDRYARILTTDQAISELDKGLADKT